jgi:hypothetical protein
MRPRTFRSIVACAILTIVLYWWCLSQENQMFNNIQYHFESASTEPELKGLKFIEADHPYIRVYDSSVNNALKN